MFPGTQNASRRPLPISRRPALHFVCPQQHFYGVAARWTKWKVSNLRGQDNMAPMHGGKKWGESEAWLARETDTKPLAAPITW